MNFLNSPGLPEAEISAAAVSATYPAFTAGLRNLGIYTIKIHSQSQLAESVKNHADTVCFYAGSGIVYVGAGETLLKNEFLQEEFLTEEISEPVYSPYPHDTLLNALLLGKRLFANQKNLASELIDYCNAHSIKIVSVKQGYTKCSCAVVDKHSIITADEGIAKTAELEGIQVLRIRPGYIQLSGCSYGFIGGTCGKIARDKLAFAGRIQDHPDFPMIKDFLKKRGIHPVVLADEPLTDIGGILPLMY